MKQAPNARKQRARTAPRKGGKSNNSSGSNAGNRNDNRSRGNPKQLLEKYKNQARDALQSGDRVEAEYFFQFADHYQRVVNEMQSREPKEGQQNNRDQNGEDGQQNNRRGRGRRGRHADQQDSQENKEQPTAENQQKVGEENSKAPEKDTAADPAAAEQPQEVHPELDLASPVGDAEEKPKRRAPVRRRAPKKEAVASDENGEEAPKPRARRTRKPKEDTADAAPVADAPTKDGEAAA